MKFLQNLKNMNCIKAFFKELKKELPIYIDKCIMSVSNKIVLLCILVALIFMPSFVFTVLVLVVLAVLVGKFIHFSENWRE